MSATPVPHRLPHMTAGRAVPLPAAGRPRKRGLLQSRETEVRVYGSLFSDDPIIGPTRSAEALLDDLARFRWHDRETHIDRLTTAGYELPVFVNEFWTSRQRAAHSLHEVSYRACFKPQLPGFFIDRLSSAGDRVYDPFAGRGTTLVEAALKGRTAAGCDVNPLSERLIRPRLAPPRLHDVSKRMYEVDLRWQGDLPPDLLAFYHPDTLGEICALRAYLLRREHDGQLDPIDWWIRMVTVNRLTGHSAGFLSVYTLPPNQAVSVESQQKINRDRQQSPPRRDTRRIVVKKSAALLQDLDEPTHTRLRDLSPSLLFRTGSCADTFWSADSVRLIVTSPPFLDVVDYATDNWLRCWFCGIDAREVRLALFRRPQEWSTFMTTAFRQLHRLLEPGGFIAFEVGEVRGGAVKLEHYVVPAAAEAGLRPVCVLVNQQAFTKTANIWGVSNNAKGTNTNRVVVLERPASRPV